jgi:hypothetical protein
LGSKTIFAAAGFFRENQNPPNTISQSIGGTGISPVQAQAKACGYLELPFDCNSV